MAFAYTSTRPMKFVIDLTYSWSLMSRLMLSGLSWKARRGEFTLVPGRGSKKKLRTRIARLEEDQKQGVYGRDGGK